MFTRAMWNGIGLALMLGICPAIGGEKQLLPNADLTLEEGQKVPDGWYTAKDTNLPQNDASAKTPDGRLPLKIAITQDKNAVGYLSCGIKLTKPNQNLTFTGQLKSTLAKGGYFEIRLTKSGKVLKQVASDPSATEWTTRTLKVQTDDADSVNILCRYVERKEAVDSAVWFAGLSLLSDTRQICIALVGDSTVATYKQEQALRGWGQLLPKFLKPETEVRNAAVPGTSSKTFPDSNRWKNVLVGKPDYIFIQFGHNDAHDKSKPEATDAATTYRENLKKMIAEARNAGAVPVLVTPMHRRLFSSNKISMELEPYAEAMREVAAEAKAPLIDLHALSGAALEKLGDKGCLPYFASATDRSHFSEKGATLLAGLIAAEISKQIPELAGELLEQSQWPKVE